MRNLWIAAADTDIGPVFRIDLASVFVIFALGAIVGAIAGVTYLDSRRTKRERNN